MVIVLWKSHTVAALDEKKMCVIQSIKIESKKRKTPSDHLKF